MEIAGAAWSAVTFFVVPVILYEPLGVVDSVKRSGSIFKQKWGEQFVGNASIGMAVMLIALPFAAISVGLISVAPPIGIVFAVVTLGALFAAGSAMGGIFNAALYRFAVTGEVGGAFTADDLGGAFRPKR